MSKECNTTHCPHGKTRGRPPKRSSLCTFFFYPDNCMGTTNGCGRLQLYVHTPREGETYAHAATVSRVFRRTLLMQPARVVICNQMVCTNFVSFVSTSQVKIHPNYSAFHLYMVCWEHSAPDALRDTIPRPILRAFVFDCYHKKRAPRQAKTSK